MPHRAALRLIAVIALCLALPLLSLAAPMAQQPGAYIPDHDTRECAACPQGYEVYRAKCVKASIRCGARHSDLGDACYKRYGKPGMLSHVKCAPTQTRSFDQCYPNCRGKYFSDYEACYNTRDPLDVYFREPVPPLRRWCDKGYWLDGEYCRTSCPGGFAWDQTGCRVKWCPKGTTSAGELCVKPTKPCLRFA